MPRKQKALYATISYFGDTWTVYYQKRRTNRNLTTGTTTGYGEFPRDKFPDIPIIDYTGNESIFQKVRMNLLVEETTILSTFTAQFFSVISLKKFLEIHKTLGIKIINC